MPQPPIDLSQKIARASDGFLTCLTDLSLYWIFFSVELMGAGRSTHGIYEASRKAQQETEKFHGLPELEIEYDRFQRKLYYLKKRGLIDSARGRLKEIQLTRLGRKRLTELFPIYRTSRPWDSKIYLVTYDIVEERKKERDLLRDHLKRLGCAMLQASVYVSVYDPRNVLREWSQKRGFTDSILVSDVGEDGSIAGKTISELTTKLYNLEEVNDRYAFFIRDFEGFKHPDEVNQNRLHVDWSTCVENDPQLPFELLPKGFLGERAYKLYSKLVVVKLEGLDEKAEDVWKLSERKYRRARKRERYGELHDLEKKYF